jgi:hypothetical protein
MLLDAIKSITDMFVTLNSLWLPVGGLVYSRSQMPQISETYKKMYLNHFKGMGVSVVPRMMYLRDIKLTQNEINKTKVWKLMQAIRKNAKRFRSMPKIIVSKDGYVVDGSHRFVAALNLDRAGEIEVWQINMPIRQILKESQKLMGIVEYRTISDSKLADKYH